MGYITSDALKASLDLTGETYADADITLAIDAASAQIDSACNRRFTLDPDNTSQRFYTPHTWSLVEIDDVVDVQEIALDPGDGTFSQILTENTDYVLEPLNAVADSYPYTYFRLLHHHHRVWCGHARTRSVRVTGQFGWSAVPALVEGATSLLAGRILRRIREAPFGIVQVGLDGAVARIAQTDPDIAGMLKPVTRMLVR